MKYFMILLIFVDSAMLAPNAFGSEPLYGTSSFENTPSELTPGKPTQFEIKFRYTEGPYALSNFFPVIDVSPPSASLMVHIDVESLEGITQGQVVRIPVTITVNPNIEHEKIFLSIYFTGDHFSSRSDAFYKSAWSDSITFDIVPKIQAEDKDMLEELVDRYAEIAEKNVNAMKTRDNLQQELDDELKKSIPDIAMIEDLQKAIDGQHVIIKNTAMELAAIQAKVTEESQMDPKFKQILKNARDILYENQEMIPWTNLGVSNSKQTVTISIDAENPEDYRMIIENLVGKDIPVVIKKGGNPFVKDNVIMSPSQQFKAGVPIDEVQCKDNLQLILKTSNNFPTCVKPETAPKLIERGWGEPAPIPEPDTGEFRYGEQECHYIDANEEQRSCIILGWAKPVSELDCEEICKPPGTKE